MALCFDTNITADGNADITLKNKRTGQSNRFTIYVYGDFGAGTLGVQLSPDQGTTFISNINDGAALEFTADQVENINVNSDEANPVILRFALSGSTNPDLNIKVYNNG